MMVCVSAFIGRIAAAKATAGICVTQGFSYIEEFLVPTNEVLVSDKRKSALPK